MDEKRGIPRDDGGDVGKETRRVLLHVAPSAYSGSVLHYQGALMVTLHIEHPITDLQTWLGAFRRFEAARAKAGVRSQHIRQPVDDDKYIYVALEFESVEEAAAFKDFLETNVWSSAEASPALDGTPKARVLTEVSTAG